MRILLILRFLLLLAVPVSAADLSLVMRDVATPVYDASGHLIRRLTADSASGPFSLPHLENAKIDFFSPRSDEIPTAVLTCEHASYHKATETISGDDLVQLTSPRGILSGRGYVCQVAAGRLTLRSHVTFSSDQVLLRGTEAEVHFDPKRGNQDQVIREAIVSGTVTFEPGAATADFDRAETTHARYDAGQQKIFLKSPVTIWRKGQKSVTTVRSGFVEIDLAEKTVPVPAAAPLH